MYLVYYEDGSIQIYVQEQKPKNHQEGARIFKVPENLTVSDISEILSCNGFVDGFQNGDWGIDRLH